MGRVYRIELIRDILKNIMYYIVMPLTRFGGEIKSIIYVPTVLRYHCTPSFASSAPRDWRGEITASMPSLIGRAWMKIKTTQNIDEGTRGLHPNTHNRASLTWMCWVAC